jgi:hypothetical protein
VVEEEEEEEEENKKGGYRVAIAASSARNFTSREHTHEGVCQCVQWRRTQDIGRQRLQRLEQSITRAVIGARVGRMDCHVQRDLNGSAVDCAMHPYPLQRVVEAANSTKQLQDNHEGK